MVINFWGTWCEPSVKEMPALQAQADKWKDQGVQFVGINVREPMTVDNFIRQVGVTFPIMLDQNKTIMISDLSHADDILYPTRRIHSYRAT